MNANVFEAQKALRASYEANPSLANVVSQDSTIRIVANRLGVRLLSLEVRVTGQVDLRGALGMSADVPVGFHAFDCDVTLRAEEGTPPQLLQQLQLFAERACVVQQTLRAPPGVRTTFDLG
ncbi:MAG: hypothetical protein RIS35_895 [Pseudomonadota bacterium]|jgi:hypothetical protein